MSLFSDGNSKMRRLATAILLLQNFTGFVDGFALRLKRVAAKAHTGAKSKSQTAVASKSESQSKAKQLIGTDDCMCDCCLYKLFKK